MNRRAVALCLVLGVIAAVLSNLGGCVTYRLARYGYLSPVRQDSVFPHRLVKRAASAFLFVRAREQRGDLDTITVRSPDGSAVTWADYMRRSQVRAFLVVRNDSILYERYLSGYTDSTRSGSYSMAKSFTSVLLGIAIGRHEVRSIDDSITAYVPELRSNPAFAGVTIRDALGMKTGLAYERMNGHTRQDLRSGDAEFYYTSHLDDAMRQMHRAAAPGGQWSYSDADAQLLACVLRLATGVPLAQQLD